MSTWMMPGPGMAWYLGGGVSPGQAYVPDEVAKQLVKESGLRKSDTVPKRVIVHYLETMGLSPGLAPDVAMVLRNNYGIQPTFDESADTFGASLLEELRGTLPESFAMPFRVDAPQVLTEEQLLDDLSGRFFGPFVEGCEESVAMLEGCEFSQLMEMVEFSDLVGQEGLRYIEDMARYGPDGFAEAVVDAYVDGINGRYMSEDVSDDVYEWAVGLHEIAVAAPAAAPAKRNPEIDRVFGKKKDPPAAAPAKRNPEIDRVFGKKKSSPSEMTPDQRKQRLATMGKTGALLQKQDRKELKRDLRKHGQETPGPDTRTASEKYLPAIRKKQADQAAAKGAAADAARKRQQSAVPDDKKQMKRAAKDRLAGQVDPLQKKAADKAAGKSVAPASKPADSGEKKPGLLKRAGQAIAGIFKRKSPDADSAPTGMAAVSAAQKSAKQGSLGNIKAQTTHGNAVPDAAPPPSASKSAAPSSSAGPSSGPGAASPSSGTAPAATPPAAAPSATPAATPAAGAAPKQKTSLSTKLGRATGAGAAGVVNFFGKAKQGYQQARQQHANEPAAAPTAKKRVGAVPLSNSLQLPFRQAALLDELRVHVSGEVIDVGESFIPEPADVVAMFEASTLVEQAIAETIADLSWDEVCEAARFIAIDPSYAIELHQAYDQGVRAFRDQWSVLESEGSLPRGVKAAHFVRIAERTGDASVLPAFVFWAARTLSEAGRDVMEAVLESYPELGKTVYGPAGDPKRGPILAKAYLSPENMTPRMFQDPSERDARRRVGYTAAVKAIGSMEMAAADAGVPPEGMFLNVYRDMHREKIRYS